MSADDACWVGHFCVEPGIFVSNHAFCCGTECFLCQTRVIFVHKVHPQYCTQDLCRVLLWFGTS